MNKLLVITGATATGKTDVALSLAHVFKGELISADSRQVYKGLDIGTGKLPGREAVVKKLDKHWMVNGIRIWGYDLVLPAQQYSVKEYIGDITDIIADISSRENLPILVGGSGLYIRGLLEGIDRLDVPVDVYLRKILEAKSLEEVQQQLKLVSPGLWNELNESEKGNKRRLIRHIERVHLSHRLESKRRGLCEQYEILKVGLSAPREVLYRRIDERLDRRIKQGMIEEAQSLHARGLSMERMDELGLEYRYLALLLQGKITSDELRILLRTKIHQYAKRQMTWFKREKNVHWFDITKEGYLYDIEKLVQRWYNEGVTEK